MKRIYVGYTPQGTREVFRTEGTPTQESHGHLYSWVMGPFDTMRGARFYQDYGAGNPHTTTVHACERIAKWYAEHPNQ